MNPRSEVVGAQVSRATIPGLSSSQHSAQGSSWVPCVAPFFVSFFLFESKAAFLRPWIPMGGCQGPRASELPFLFVNS